MEATSQILGDCEDPADRTYVFSSPSSGACLIPKKSSFLIPTCCMELGWGALWREIMGRLFGPGLLKQNELDWEDLS